MRCSRNLTVVALLFVALVAANGCATGQRESWTFAKKLDPRRAVGWKSDEPIEPQKPRRLVATWVDTTLSTPGEKPLRGFGGRLVFFGPEGEESVAVAGELVVYAFDETDRSPHETHPTRRYIFPAEQFAKHESPSRFGPSYSVWLPWDAVGGQQKNISLIARFEPQGGAMVVGEQTAHLLPGIVRPEQAIAAQQPPADVQLAGYQAGGNSPASAGMSTAGGAAPDVARRSTATIDLPDAMAARLARGKQTVQQNRDASGFATRSVVDSSAIQSSPAPASEPTGPTSSTSPEPAAPRRSTGANWGWGAEPLTWQSTESQR